MKVPTAARSPELTRLFHPPAFAVFKGHSRIDPARVTLNEAARQILIVTECAVFRARAAEVDAGARREPPIFPACRAASVASQAQAESADVLFRSRPCRCRRDRSVPRLYRGSHGGPSSRYGASSWRMNGIRAPPVSTAPSRPTGGGQSGPEVRTSPAPSQPLRRPSAPNKG